MRIDGFIPFIGGLYAFLLFSGLIPAKPKAPEKFKAYVEKYGGIMKVVSIVTMLWGLMLLFFY